MVDRITPATTDTDRAEVRDRFGVDRANPYNFTGLATSGSGIEGDALCACLFIDRHKATGYLWRAAGGP